MHKRFVNHCTIELTLIPDGPILIKSGIEGADPTKPNMEFVETYYGGGKSIYLPGSGLKGAIRAHGERIIRTVGQDSRPRNKNDNGNNTIWANDPINDKYDYLKDSNGKDLLPPEIYKNSSFTDQIFGNTSIASRFRVEDAYPIDPKQIKLEERNGVAIDRVFGSVAVGPFNYQVCTGGEFKTKLHLKNFTLAQLALIGLVLRDLNDGWFGLGFAKSRGLGTVSVKYNCAKVQYPGCILSQDSQNNRKIKQLGNSGEWDSNLLLGAGEFLSTEEAKKYGFLKPDKEKTPIRAEEMDLGFGVEMKWEGNEDNGVKDLFIKAVNSWNQALIVT